ncbi:tRNA(m(1)G37)methyltransferase [Rhizoclosmatium sp. JEL0117]|nr:tRNA(m(1)G37)methyltransferase [Rhizoclosmatium sp. JEL0117]
MAAHLLPPLNRNLTALTAEAKAKLFTRTVNLVALRVPATVCNKALQVLPPHLLDIPRLRSIVNDESSSKTRLVLLNPTITSDAIPEKVKEFIDANNAEIVDTYPLKLDYDYWTADQILRSIIPDELNIPSSFELIGHIAHMNLRKEYLPYKKIVGEVILDKNQYIRTVVNKTDSIDHTFRFFKMELLAGDDDLLAELKESNCKFKFDFSKVYWNSCLQTEHDRIVSQFFAKNDTVCDVMAGVGPFALPAAKNRGCTVFANDLNPESFKWLSENVVGNKLGHLVRAYNMDGRDFITKSLVDLNNAEITDEMKAKAPPPPASRSRDGKKKHADGATKDATVDSEQKKAVVAEPKTEVASGPTKIKIFNHYVMNLPATALEFLDAFRGLFYEREAEVPAQSLPIIHVHCFSNVIDDLEGDVWRRAETFLGCDIPQENIIKIHRVRDVAPKKEMLCISFRLPAEAAYAKPVSRAEKRKIDEVDE